MLNKISLLNIRKFLMLYKFKISFSYYGLLWKYNIYILNKKKSSKYE